MKVPQLVVHGDKDTSISIDEAYKIYSWNKNSILKTIKNADHVFNVSHPWKQETVSKELEEVIQTCIKFLR